MKEISYELPSPYLVAEIFALIGFYILDDFHSKSIIYIIYNIIVINIIFQNSLNTVNFYWLLSKIFVILYSLYSIINTSAR